MFLPLVSICVGLVLVLGGYYLGTVREKRLKLKKAEELKRLIDGCKDKEEAVRRVLFEGLGYKSKILAEVEDEVAELKTATRKRNKKIVVLKQEFEDAPAEEWEERKKELSVLYRKNTKAEKRISEIWALVDTFHPREERGYLFL